MRNVSLLLALLCAALPGGAEAEEPPVAEQLVSVSLVAEQASAGSAWWLGVVFEVADGWHIYWQNPGGSGMETTVSLLLPEGWSSEEVQFPGPERFQDPGDIETFGYQGGTVLMATVQPPPDWSSLALLSAESTYLVCREVCLFGEATATLALEAGAPSGFSPITLHEARLRLPRPLETLAGAKWSQEGEGTDQSLVLSTGSELPTDFFPSLNSVDLFGATASARVMEGNQIRLPLSGAAASGRIAQGVLATRGEAGSSFWQVAVPLN